MQRVVPGSTLTPQQQHMMQLQQQQHVMQLQQQQHQQQQQQQQQHHIMQQRTSKRFREVGLIDGFIGADELCGTNYRQDVLVRCTRVGDPAVRA